MLQFWRDVRHFPGWPPMLSSGRYGGASPQPHRGTGACSTTSASGCEFPSATCRSPFGKCDECRTKLGIVRHAGIVGGEAHQRREPEPLLVGDPEPQMLVQHPLIAAELFGVCGRSAEHLAPPGGDIASMVRVYAAREEGRQQLVVFDAVVERVDHSVEGTASAARPPPTPGLPSRPLTSRVDGRCAAVLTGVDACGLVRVASALGSKGWTGAPFVQEPNCVGVAAVATGGPAFGSSSRTLRIANTRW